jgi:hypothetical protein
MEGFARYNRTELIKRKIKSGVSLVILLTACNFTKLVNEGITVEGTLSNPVETEGIPVERTMPDPTLTDSTPVENIWHPEPGTTWQWQLTGSAIDLSYNVEVYDIDLFDVDEETIAALKDQGRKVICYLSAGSWEDWRPDADRYPKEIIGKKYEGWEGERWLDIRQIDQLAPILEARFDLCRQKGFVGIEADNVDGYMNETGFPLTAEDQLNFNRWLADQAHTRGLAIGLKNDGEQVEALLPFFDFALVEDCFAENWCEQVLPFVRANKAVFAAEYTDTGIQLEDFCREASQQGISVILKNRDLDAWMMDCS